MAWIFAAVVLCLLVFVPGFRKAALILLGVLAGIAFIAIIANSIRDEQRRYAETHPPTPVQPSPTQIPRKTIPTALIRFSDLHWQLNQERRINSVSLRVYNDSETDTLDSIKYRLTIDDCRLMDKASAHCATVHDQTSLVYMNIPPKQARDASISVPVESYGASPTILGTPKLQLNIVEATPRDAP
jgi:hypothetical protein